MSDDWCWCAFEQEVFTALLMQPVANPETNDPSNTFDITVADIIGPLLEKEAGTSAEVVDARDVNFSLLSYSFSLVGLSSQPRTTCSCAKAGLWLGRRRRAQHRVWAARRWAQVKGFR